MRIGHYAVVALLCFPRRRGEAIVTTEAEKIVSQFIGAFERNDVNELVDFFTDDAVWHPGPLKPAVGKPAIREAITQWLAATTQLPAEIHLQVSDGNTVLNERTDRFLLGTREMTTPIAAVYEIDNGRIAAWREYFDMSDYRSARRAAQESGG
jgi:limonene-1,2-epoxide hydrolase